MNAPPFGMHGGRAKAVEFDHVAKTWPRKNDVGTQAIAEVSFGIETGEFVSIVGPSGCGKSTLLNMAAGFITPTSGEVRVYGGPVTGIPERLGYIFQKDTCLPWCTVRQNIAVGMRFTGVARARIDQKIEQLLTLTNLAAFAHHYPYQLSGGMRRRVNLAMSLACEPKVLLLDEPFGALDTHTKTHLHNQLLQIKRELGQTIVLVTHDLDEAVTLSDRIVALSSAPSRVALIEPVEIPHPRDVFTVRETEQFSRHFLRVWRILGREFKSVAPENH